MCFEWLGSIRLGDYAALGKRKHSQPYSGSSHNIKKANYKIPQDSKAVLLCARGKKKKFFLCFLMILLPRQGHSRTLWDTPEMLTGEKLLRAIPTSTQQLPQLPMAVGGISSRPLFWQQFGHGQKLGKTSGSRNCRKYKTKPNQKPKPKQTKTKNRKRFSFSFS